MLTSLEHKTPENAVAKVVRSLVVGASEENRARDVVVQFFRCVFPLVPVLVVIVDVLFEQQDHLVYIR